MSTLPAEMSGSSSRSNNPVLFFENKLLYATIGPVPEEEYLVPIGVAEVKRAGRDVTVVAIGSMVSLARSRSVTGGSTTQGGVTDPFRAFTSLGAGL